MAAIPTTKVTNQPGEPFRLLDPANDNQPVTLDFVPTIDALDFEEASIPRREWLVPGLLIRRHMSVLVAPPGAGKSLLTLQLALAMATGEDWGGFCPRDPLRVLVVNAEDDTDEVRRRLAAASRIMGIDRARLKGRVLLAEDPQSIVVARTDPKNKTVTRTPLVERIAATVVHQKVDVLVVDPFAETFEGDENSNSEIKWAAVIWREVARRTGCALLLVHHVSKAGSAAPGDMNAARGGSALVGVARTVSTLFGMAENDAKAMGVANDERHLYARFDDAKANMSLVTRDAKWFRKESVRLRNATLTQQGDEVGVFVPWSPPSEMEGLTTGMIIAILDELAVGVTDEDGKPTGTLYAYSDNRRGERWAGHVVTRHCDMPIEQAAKVLKTWKTNGVIAEVEFHDDGSRKLRKGIRVNSANRPGSVED